MKSNLLRPFTGFSAAILAVVFILGSCGKAKQTTFLDPAKIDSIYAASDSAPRTIDSLLQQGIIGPIAANYYMIYYWANINDTLCKSYAEKALQGEVKNDQDRFYQYCTAGIYTQFDYIAGHYERGIRRAKEFYDNMDPAFISTHFKLKSICISINQLLGFYNIHLYRFDEAEEQLKKTLQLIDQYIEEAHGDSAQLQRFNKDRVQLCDLAMVAYGNLAQYDRALHWLNLDEVYLNDYAQKYDKKFADEWLARLNTMKAYILHRTGHVDEATQTFQKVIESPSYNGTMMRVNAVPYLLEAHRYQEALENIDCIEDWMRVRGLQWNLDNIAGNVAMRFYAYLGVGRRDSALAIATRIIRSLDSAAVWVRRDKAAELATIYDMNDKEAQIAEKEASLLQTRVTALIVAIVLLIVFFIVYSVLRRRAAMLKAVQDRIEGELQIAREIQMSMVPHEFPHRDGLDMYASMTPAKEVGGDLYGYLIRGHMLYFAVGDVSGKGVPASLFMAQATRLFRSLANQDMMPAEICTRMNAELGGEDNVNGMFVTMWIGMLNMENGHLHFCNAGHNPPIIGGGDNHGDFLQMESNAPIGLWPDLEYVGEEIESIKGCPLFVYTDGLNEAEDPEQRQFGDEHLLSILRDTHFDSAQQVIETLAAQVTEHRRGADANDDLTMLCLRVN